MLSYTETDGGKIPLTNEESAFLKHIYLTRIKVFVPAYFFLLLIAFYSGLSIDGKADRWGKRYIYKTKSTGFSRVQMYAITIPLMESFVVISGIIFFRKRIWVIRKDIKNNVKEPVHYIVTQKASFAHTGQFFIGLNHPDYLFHEVDFNVWKDIVVGEQFSVFRAPLSKYIFNPQGKFTII